MCVTVSGINYECVATVMQHCSLSSIVPSIVELHGSLSTLQNACGS